jgi:hypothetical protein
MGLDREEIPVPEAAALIAFSRTQCTREDLYDVPYPVQGYITMSVSRVKQYRSLGDTHHMNENELIEVKMSYSQFAEAITTMNYGCGVPCTLNYFNGEKIPSIENQIHEVDLFTDDVIDEVAEMAGKIDRLYHEVAAAKISKGLQTRLLSQISSLSGVLKDRLPFIEKVYIEKLDKLKAKVKTDIAAWMDHIAINKGIESIKSDHLLSGDEEN